jgi:hypothetical protein
MLIVLKSESLNFLEPSVTVKTCNGIALPIPFTPLLSGMEQLLLAINAVRWNMKLGYMSHYRDSTTRWTTQKYWLDTQEVHRILFPLLWCQPSPLSDGYMKLFLWGKMANQISLFMLLPRRVGGGGLLQTSSCLHDAL